MNDAIAETSFEIVQRKTVRYAVTCRDCGFVHHSTPNRLYAERTLAKVNACPNCPELSRIAAMPKHHPHHSSHSKAYQRAGTWFCCAAVQLGFVGENECVECGQDWPCEASRRPVHA